MPLVEVWWIDVDLPLSEGVEAVLAPPERERWRAFARPGDARRYLLGALAVRSLAGEAVGATPATVVVDRTCGDCERQHGRPVVRHDDLGLSVSHSGGLVVVAAGPGRIGVDVEQVRPDAPVDDLASQFLSPAEVGGLTRLDERSRRRRFFELWTEREAALKATGEGLRIDPRTVVVTSDHGRGRTAEAPGHAPLQLHRLDAPAPDHAAALATEPGTGVVVRRVVGLGADGTIRSA